MYKDHIGPWLLQRAESIGWHGGPAAAARRVAAEGGCARAEPDPAVRAAAPRWRRRRREAREWDEAERHRREGVPHRAGAADDDAAGGAEEDVSEGGIGRAAVALGRSAGLSVTIIKKLAEGRRTDGLCLELSSTLGLWHPLSLARA